MPRTDPLPLQDTFQSVTYCVVHPFQQQQLTRTASKNISLLQNDPVNESMHNFKIKIEKWSQCKPYIDNSFHVKDKEIIS